MGKAKNIKDTARTKDTKKQLKKAGLSDEDIKKLQGKQGWYAWPPAKFAVSLPAMWLKILLSLTAYRLACFFVCHV